MPRSGVLAGLLLCLAPACGPPADPVLRHVVLITLDTTRADALGCYGGTAATPRLDALAASSVRFADATAAAPTTLASHTSILTGLYPHRHGVPRNGFAVSEDNRTLPQILEEQGFETAAFVASFALDRQFGLARGFEVYDQELVQDPPGSGPVQRRAEEVTDAALAFLEQRTADRRLFLFVHYFDPHAPFDPPPPYGVRPASAGGPRAAGLREIGAAVERHHRELGVQPEKVSESVRHREGLARELLDSGGAAPLGDDEQFAALYAAEVTYMDHHVGRLVDGLGNHGILEDALVIVVADHGETFWEHPDFWNHGLWVYQTTVHVPLLIRLPGGRHAGMVSDVPVSTVDLVPTVLDLLSLPPRATEGVSLRSAWEDPGWTRGPVFTEATQPALPPLETALPWANAFKPRAVRSGSLKFIHAPYLKYQELYDLAADPREVVNRVADADLEPAREVLGHALQQFSAAADPPASDYVGGSGTREALQALGYTEGEK